MAQHLIESGVLTPAQASKYRLQHILTQVMGVEIEAMYTGTGTVKPGDIFLLCSDGLYDMVADDDIKAILWAGSAPPAVCDRLLDAALENGGRDNVTVIVVKV